jgi:hypothetical protein
MILYCKNAMDKDTNVLSAQVLNRHQDNLDLLYRFSENYCCT